MPIATVNGVNLAYVVKGRGTPLVAMHGFAHSTYTWEPVMDALSRRCQVFAYDHRGHGASGTPQAPYDIPALADDLLGLLNFWGLDRVHLMGHSMGGRTALWFALQRPEKLESLTLVGASAAAPEGEARKRWERFAQDRTGGGGGGDAGERGDAGRRSPKPTRRERAPRRSGNDTSGTRPPAVPRR